MSKFSTIVSLVHSLSKAEKRQFKLYSSLQKGEKDYVALFQVIEKYHNEEAIKKAFENRCKGSVFTVATKHLYKVLTDSLLQLKMGQDKESALHTELLKATILLDKSLYREGFEVLHKVQRDAEAYEQYILLLLAARMELNYLNSLNFPGLTEKELQKKQGKIEEVIRYIKNSHQHSTLYEILKCRLAYKGHVRTDEQKKELNDLVVSEMTIMANPLAFTVESAKIHLLFQANYFITINDYISALKAFYELIELLEEHRYLWIDSPVDYLVSIEGILDSLRTIGQFESMNFFLDKLAKLPRQTGQFEVMIQRVNYIYILSSYTDRGQYRKALLLPGKFKESLFDKIDMLDPNKQAEVFLYTALIYFGNNDLDKSHLYLGKVLFKGKQYYKLPVFQTFRLLHLLIHHEMGNDDVVMNELRSVKRTMFSGQRKTYRVEKIIFSFVQLSGQSLSNKEKTALAEKYKSMFLAIGSEKNEIQVLKIFDFASWIESKITGRTFEEVVNNKLKRFESA
ncbi:hypothetical protein BH10BAC3_BH10BAC3_38100 [soil metagenome]